MVVAAEPSNDLDSNEDMGLLQVVPLADAAFAAICGREI